MGDLVGKAIFVYFPEQRYYTFNTCNRIEFVVERDVQERQTMPLGLSWYYQFVSHL